MTKDIKVTFSFEDRAQILDKESETLQTYSKFFNEKILPEMKDTERRKNQAIEEAYKIHICKPSY